MSDEPHIENWIALLEQQHRFIQIALAPRIAKNELTLRDQFAMAAMTGLCVNNQIHDSPAYANMAYEIADAMMEARK